MPGVSSEPKLRGDALEARMYFPTGEEVSLGEARLSYHMDEKE